MKDKRFLVGPNVTWVDFYFVELLDFMNFLTDNVLF